MSHTGFQLISTSVTLSGVIALILRFFTEFDCFAGQLRNIGWRQTYIVRKILSPSSSLPLLAITNPPCYAAVLTNLYTLDFFIALHGMQMWSSDEKAVCPPVCQTHDVRQNERGLCPDSYTTLKNIYSRFVARRMVGGGDPFYLKFWVKLTLLESNCRFSVDIWS